MRDRRVFAWFIVAGILWPSLILAQCPPDQPILTGATLASGLSIGLNTSNNRTDWLITDGSMLILQYPSGQAWGAVFVTPGPAVPPGNRPSRNMSGCQSLTLEMSGDPGAIEIGIKDSAQPDDGTETKVQVQITGQWQTYTIPLSRFARADLKRVYVLVEFVFGGPQSQTVRVRNIKYTSAATNTRILPQFAFGGSWYSSLYFANTSDQPQSLRVQFVGDDGRPLFVPAVGFSSTDVSLPPRGSAIIEAPNSGPLSQGYVSVSLPEGVIGYGIFRQSPEGRGDQEAVVPLSGASGTASTLIWDDTAFVTAVAIVNPSAVGTTVTITARDTSGAVIGRSGVPLAAGAKTAVVMKDLPGLSAMTGRRGSAEFTVTSGNVAVLGLRFGAQAFTSIPTSDK